MVKEIPLSKGQVTIVDDEDYEELSRWTWHASWNESVGSYYARRNRRENNGRGAQPRMHRQILGVRDDPSVIVDHRNRNTLDNRRENLRVATIGQSNVNRRQISTTGYRGVWRGDRKRPTWRARIRLSDGTEGRAKAINLGTFDTPTEAARA